MLDPGRPAGDSRSCLSDFEDYLEDRVAPVLIQSSLSAALNTSGRGPVSPQDLAAFIIHWARRKAAQSGDAIYPHLLFALGSVVRADQYQILDDFDGAIFYPLFILKLIELMPAEEIRHFQDGIRIHQEKIWDVLNRKTQPAGEISLPPLPVPPDPFPPPAAPVNRFDDALAQIMAQIPGADHRLENGDFAYRALFEQIEAELASCPGYDESVRHLSALKKAAIRMFNNSQILATWMFAHMADTELKKRRNDLLYRVVFEAGAASELSLDVLREMLSETVFYPLLTPLCRLFHELSPGELLILLMTENDQTMRKLYYNLVKVYGNSIFSIMLEEMHNPANHPWYYLRNVASLLGEMAPLDNEQKRSAAEVMARYIGLEHRRQLVIACIHGVARLGGNVAEMILINLMARKVAPAAGGEDDDLLNPLEFASKLLEGLCMLNTERSIQEVLEFAMGKHSPLTNQHEALQHFALEQLGRLDLNLFPALRTKLMAWIMEELVNPRFTLKKAFTRHNVRLESAIASSLRHTRGIDSMVLLKKIMESTIQLEVREAARQILEEQDKDRTATVFNYPEERSFNS